MILKKINASVLFFMLLIFSCALKIGCNFKLDQKVAEKSEFSKYPLEKYIDYRLNTLYWNLPKIQDEKHALKTEIEHLYATILGFNEKKLAPAQTLELLGVHKRGLASLMKMAFRKYMPDDISIFENINYTPGTDNSKAIYKYRLPNTEETENEKLWEAWVRNRNLYMTSIWIMDSVLEHAYIDAMFELKELGVPNSYIAFDIALNGELKRMSELMQNK